MQFCSIHPDAVQPGELGRTVEGVDAVLAVAMLVFLRHRIGEATLEVDQVGPVDPNLAFHAPAGHPPLCVDDFRSADKHLLGIAAAQGAGAAERLFVAATIAAVPVPMMTRSNCIFCDRPPAKLGWRRYRFLRHM